ncbi:flagellar basal-body MS-ring/collar protein FliF [Tropicimonas marinistellae]|uniref:flagellar basal-body MS-ring/collar protein FliF n=1 Tax=Tropicimonas marinistellae TaxID=1739787 RepID=UPI000832EFE3|nr:flagellar basal-body MS-ring/collar protein FliF [Tropicimonas marinistellae]
MQNVLETWSNLDSRRRIIVVAAAIAVFAAVLLLSRIAATRPMELLYAGLESGAAGEVVTALEQRGVSYDVRGSAIYVDAASRDEIRMVLASQSLPSNGSAGYELLDGLNGFGTTSQMFDAAYWRAKEGELARTITATRQVRSARVHISASPSRGFRSNGDMSASVSVSATANGLTASQARSFRFLVASAVSGLQPDDVTVIDGDSGLVQGSDDSQPAENGRKAEGLKRNVERLLEAHVGPGNAVVEVSVETVTERESITERRFDPEGRVAISTETEERSTNSQGGVSGAVSVASNLPDGDAASDGAQSSSQNSESRERVNFEVSETHREVLKVPGAIRRVTVAVLVNATTTTDSSGAEVTTPRSEEELADLESLIAAAVGYDADRGDQITIRSMAFEPYAEGVDTAAHSLLDRLDLTRILQVAGLAIVALILGLFVVRPILTRTAPAKALELQASSDATVGSTAIPPAPALTGEIADDSFAPDMQVVTDFDMGDDSGFGGLPDLPSPDIDPVARLRSLINERQQETVEVLRSWMEDDRRDA